MENFKKKVGPAIFVVGILFLGIKLYMNHAEKGAEKGVSPASQQVVLETPLEEKERLAKLRPINILFIGNSYTYFNDMPQMLNDMALSDKASQYNLVLKVYAQEGANLTQQWQDGKALELIRSQKWDHVILQEQSFWTMDDVNISNTHKAANDFAQEIKAGGANVILFQSWARQGGSKWYKDIKYAPILRNPEYMQQKIDQQTKELADMLGAKVLQVGDYWAYAMRQNPKMNLFDRDGSHPSPLGSFFTASLLYRFFTGRMPDETPYVAKGVDINAGNELKKMASVK